MSAVTSTRVVVPRSLPQQTLSTFPQALRRRTQHVPKARRRLPLAPGDPRNAGVPHDLIVRAVAATGMAVHLFIISKLPELGDTLFLAIKGVDIGLLQWYHHCTVLTFCWHSYVT